MRFVQCCAAALSDNLFWCFLKDRDYCAKALSHPSFICIFQGTWKLGFFNYIQVGCLLFHSASGLNKRALVCSHSCLICKADQNRWIDFCFNFFFPKWLSVYCLHDKKLTEKQQQKQKKPPVNSPKNHHVQGMDWKWMKQQPIAEDTKTFQHRAISAILYIIKDFHITQ